MDGNGTPCGVLPRVSFAKSCLHLGLSSFQHVGAISLAPLKLAQATAVEVRLVSISNSADLHCKLLALNMACLQTARHVSDCISHRRQGEQ